MDTNIGSMVIETDRALDAILSNFSDNYIVDMMSDAFMYKFRPYGVSMPNYPYLFESQFKAIMDNCNISVEPVKQRREDIYLMIINTICQHYNLAITTEISYEHLWPLCYTMYRIFLSDFTNTMISFFSNYIENHVDMLISGLTEDQKTIKTNYSRKMYVDPNKMIMYENIEAALEMVASMDISFETLLTQLADQNSANLITMYISDCGDIYKNYYASYIRDPFTRTDMITSIKTRYMVMTIESMQDVVPTN